MERVRLTVLCLAMALVTLVMAVAFGGIVRAEVSPPLDIGKPVPDFKLKDYDGKEHTLSTDKGKIVVISFTSQHCPYSMGAEPAYARIAEQYGAKGVVFYSIDSHAQTTPAEIAKYATAENKTGKKLPYPVLKDVDNTYADALGAKQTPEIFIVGKDGALVYHGAIDNMKSSTDKDYKNYVAAALDDLLAGRPVAEPKHSAYGCGIKRKVA